MRRASHLCRCRVDFKPKKNLFLGRAATGSRVLLLEAIDATLGVDELVFSREERMAVGTNFHVKTAPGRFGLDAVATGADDAGWRVNGVNFLFHDGDNRFLGTALKLPYPERRNSAGRGLEGATVFCVTIKALWVNGGTLGASRWIGDRGLLGNVNGDGERFRLIGRRVPFQEVGSAR